MGKAEKHAEIKPTQCPSPVKPNPLLKSEADLTPAHLLEIMPGSLSFIRLGPMGFAGQKGRFLVSKPLERLCSCHREAFLTFRKINS